MSCLYPVGKLFGNNRFVDSPLYSSARLGNVPRLIRVITLLSWLHTDSSPVLHRSQIASRATSCTSAMMEFMPCALAPAYGVTSMCRFIQAATALSITSAVRRSYALAVLVANLFCLVLFFFLRSPISILLLQHVLTPSVIALRPFTLYLPSWCLLRLWKVKDSNPRCDYALGLCLPRLPSSTRPTFQNMSILISHSLIVS